jgi:tetratricopeptide (TPR) repeat protein
MKRLEELVEEIAVLSQQEINTGVHNGNISLGGVESLIDRGWGYYKNGNYTSAEEELEKALGNLLVLWEQNRYQYILKKIAYTSSKLSAIKLKLSRDNKEIYKTAMLAITAFESLAINEQEKNKRLAFLYRTLGVTTESEDEMMVSFKKSYEYFKKINYDTDIPTLSIFILLCGDLSNIHKEYPEEQIKYLRDEVQAIEKLKMISSVSTKKEGYARVMLSAALSKLYGLNTEHINEIKENYRIGIELLEKSLNEYPEETEDHWEIRKKVVISSKVFAAYLHTIGEDERSSEYLKKVIDYGYNSLLLEDKRIRGYVKNASYILWKKTKDKEYEYLFLEINKEDIK